ncbi:MAG TPA: methionyl-tRNA formyltransferase [Gammaproteobacteria bacterium]|nr:methionyl-tRNA formyltransferase [Gammaproteobacteria bacterium]
MSTPLKIIFAGTPDFATTILAALLDSPHEIVAVYTQPDRPAGRGRKLRPGPVKTLALQHDLPVAQPESLRDPAAQQTLAALDADVMVVVAYGLLLPPAVLETPRLGCLNIHASLLPRWRGAAPIQRAILAGDRETGITIMQMDAGLDTGPMLLRVPCAITETDTGGTLHDRLASLGARAILDVLDRLDSGELQPEPQDDALATWADKIAKDEARLDWSRPASELDRVVRAFNPWPVAFTTAPLGGETVRLRIWQARPGTDHGTDHTDATPGTVLDTGAAGITVACGEGVLTVTRLQAPGSRAMSADDFLRGHHGLMPGLRLGEATTP